MDAETIRQVHERNQWDGVWDCPSVNQAYDETLYQVIDRGLTLLEGVPNLIMCPWAMAEELLKLDHVQFSRGEEDRPLQRHKPYEEERMLLSLGYVGDYLGIPVVATVYLGVWEDPYAILSVEADPLKVDYEGPGTVMVRLRGLR